MIIAIKKPSKVKIPKKMNFDFSLGFLLQSKQIRNFGSKKFKEEQDQRLFSATEYVTINYQA